MKVSNKFGYDLLECYKDKSKLSKLFVKHKNVITNIAKHSLRHNLPGTYSTIDDMFQEACIWIIELLPRWNKEKSNIDRYIIYNVGVRLSNRIKYENTYCRSSHNNKLITYDTSEVLGNNLYIDESQIKGFGSDPFELLAFELSMSIINKSIILKNVTNTLILENGNILETAKQLHEKNIPGIASTMNSTRKLIKYKILPEIRAIFL